MKNGSVGGNTKMSKPIKNITGKRFGRLQAVEYDVVRKKWLCKCECGNTTLVSLNHLQDGHSKSCGCLHIECSRNTGRRNITHGCTKTRLYRCWLSMKSRVLYVKDKDYYNYGKRGIKVCEEWLNNFDEFKNWAMENGYQDNLTLDRIDNNGNYEPGNCRWATNIEQQRNKRNTIYVTYNGETKTLLEWCSVYNIRKDTLYRRLKHNWDIKSALVTPVKKYNRDGKEVK